MYKYKEDTLKNVFQSKLKFQPQNKENGGKKNYGETFKRKEVSKKILKNISDKNPPCNISKRLGHAEKNYWYRNLSQCNHCKKFRHREKLARQK